MENGLEYMVTKLREGDEEAYISLFKDFYISLCAYSRRYVGRKDIAEEVVSEIFFKIWENRKNLEIRHSVKAYLFQAVANNSLNYLRKLKREDRLEDYFNSTEHGNIGFEEPSGDIAEQSLLMEELTARIEDAVNQLPPRQQMSFRLKRYEGKKNREIAAQMGLSVKTVEMHLSKAMLALRQSLKDYLPAFLLYMLLK